MLGKVLLVISFVLACGAKCIQAPLGQHGVGRLTVCAFDVTGVPVSSAGIDLIQDGSNLSFKSKFHGMTAEQIPHGSYMARIEAAGFRTVRREINVYQSDTSLRAQLAVSVECGSYNGVVGVVRPAAGYHELWIKVIPVFGTGGADSRVNASGHFLIEGLDADSYLLVVLDGKSPVHTEAVEVSRLTNITVDLTKR